MNTSERGRERPDTFTRWLLGIVASLIAAGVVALWNLNGNFQRLDERVEIWTRSFNVMSIKMDEIGRRIQFIETEQANRTPRIERLEREMREITVKK